MFGVAGLLGARQPRGQGTGGEGADYQRDGECGADSPEYELDHHGDHLSLRGFVHYDLKQCLRRYLATKSPVDLDLRRVLERCALEDAIHGALT